MTSEHHAAPDVPADVDISKPAAARIYDYLLGGHHNFAVDREFGQRMVDSVPMLKQAAIENRAFLRRAVTWMLDQGIRQFLDIGSGVPSAGNVHEIAQARDPQARTVYVDYEHVAVSHAKLILDEQDVHRRRIGQAGCSISRGRSGCWWWLSFPSSAPVTTLPGCWRNTRRRCLRAPRWP